MTAPCATPEAIQLKKVVVTRKQWRKEVKKLRRKRKRQEEAILRLKEEEELDTKLKEDPAYEDWLKGQKELEDFAEEQEKLEYEAAKRRYEEENLKQGKMSSAKALRKHAKKLAKAQAALERAEQEQKAAEEAEKKRIEKMYQDMESFMNGETDVMPEGLAELVETKPGRPICPFFEKVAACRFLNACSRNHVRPGVSRVLLIPNFYSHFSLQKSHYEYDTDISLEYESSERYAHFKEFYEDVKEELEKYGTITMIRICSNIEPHLRGNLYIEYSHEREALKAYKALSGRFYAGRVIAIEFVTIPSWKSALCGLQYNGKCPKGSSCNYMHTFRNPRDEFMDKKPNRNKRESSDSPDRRSKRRRSSDRRRSPDRRRFRDRRSPYRERRPQDYHERKRFDDDRKRTHDKRSPDRKKSDGKRRNKHY